MSIVQALVAARAEMTTIVADEQASISGGKGSYKFKYASLPAILRVVVPALAKHGVLLVQSVGSEDSTVTIQTKLLHEGSTSLQSDVMHVATTGDPKDIAGKVTSARRIQLLALLGLEVADEEDSQGTQRPMSVHYAPAEQAWDATAALRRAAEKGRNVPLSEASPALNGLITHIREADGLAGGEAMSKAALARLAKLVGYTEEHDNLLVLSFLYGRVISGDTPPKLTTAWFGKELADGSWGDEVQEAWRLAA